MTGDDDPAVIRLANEFTDVVVERVQTRNGTRLRIRVPASGREILLCPLELEALTWQGHELFSQLLADGGFGGSSPRGQHGTPYGPEDEG